MALTFDENEKALTETQDGVTMPADYSFATVNDFVHSNGTHFEELQYLCLGMANHIEHLNKALNDIKKHQEIIGGVMSKQGAVWHIANKATNAM